MKTRLNTLWLSCKSQLVILSFACLPYASLSAKEVVTDLPTQEHVMVQMEKVANWQVARTQYMTHVGRARAGSETYGRWIQGAFYKGLTKLAERSENPFYETWIGYVGNAHDWKLGKVKYFADDHVIGQTNLWYYRRHKNEQALTPVKETFDWLIEQAPDDGLEFVAGRNKDNVHHCQWRWCWADALFMAPPVLFELSDITGDPKYANYAHKEFQATVDYLQDPNTKLLFRDSRYFEKKGKFGEQVFWSRGMGWVYAGVVHILENMPRDHQFRPYYESLYLEFTAAIVRLQKRDGAWPMSLLAGEKYSEPETSGTAFFTYGITWGINNDLLDESTYLPNVVKGWKVLSSAVHPDGKFGWVQGVNEKPDVVTKEDSQLFGVGAFLLAGSAMYDFLGKK
ncbi:glycoside hydrolase family 105 protein [Aestuariibacter sp. A3R04]|uniref:glycoside hydrolase family 88/105 protein n=1 Tax=Aestuariibacter sp. A3R04 TaxID=2841571 RepID=UPI001C0A4B84|nr:glycoside hydrolase family 88 protein [Aestuariibacter sp. A3R04]MBU3020689.1 glycoside hydrolase family 88 protein [Aestuariibacter sp. A3R04]